MNREYKHHNPKLYKPLMEELLDSLSTEWYDSSYGNDLVASISLNTSKNDCMTIFLPNSKIHDEDKEDFSTYVIRKNIMASYEELIICESLKEVIKKIKEIEK
tara:strand:- start:251 stop:559 length:309 start_codon:yes stop_codon:yes gene_type:complete